MKTPAIIIGALLALALGMPMLANAGDTELATPIVELMPHLKKLAPELGLSREQEARLAAWAAEAPAKRKEIEQAAMATRAQLRDAILSGADRIERETLKKQLAAQETRLIEMRSLCARMLRQTLDTEQYAKVVASYRAG
ncbi:MAG: hypothetical protein KDI82_06545 [Gammaproteobacteria bacterium]|nr:hypothetical protein [Gammaproteobacteria bacterium]